MKPLTFDPGAFVFVIVACHSWLKLEVFYYHSADYNGTNWQDDYVYQTTTQEDTNLKWMNVKIKSL